MQKKHHTIYYLKPFFILPLCVIPFRMPTNCMSLAPHAHQPTGSAGDNKPESIPEIQPIFADDWSAPFWHEDEPKFVYRLGVRHETKMVATTEQVESRYGTQSKDVEKEQTMENLWMNVTLLDEKASPKTLCPFFSRL
jgi:hypothetical protein